MVIHVRIVKRDYWASSSGHIYKGDQPKVNRNVCGAEPTSFDITPRDLKGFKNDEQWQLCKECQKRMDA